MIRCFALALVLLVSTSAAVRAQSLDDQYFALFNLIQEADNLSTNEPAKAMAKYLQAQRGLSLFQKGNPSYSPQVIDFRLSYIAGQISALSSNAPAATPLVAPSSAPAALPTTVRPAQPAVEAVTNTTADLQWQVNALKEQVARLQSDRTLLEAKLKEALAARPAESDPRELARAEERIKALQKENDLLKASVETERSKAASVQTQTPVAAADTSRVKELEREREDLLKRLDAANRAAASSKGKKASKREQELQLELTTARARLEVLEARQVPYTAEELALLKAPPPTLAEPPPKPAKKAELPPDATKLMAQAQTFYASKQYDKAEAAYSEVVKMAPRNVLSLANLAAVQSEAGKLDAAETNVKTALAESPDDGFSLYVLGLIKFRQKQYDESLDALSRAAKAEPQNAEIQNYLGLALSEKGMRGPAEAALRKAIQLQPNYALAHYHLAVAYVTQQPPAIELGRWHYQKALALGFPRNPEFEAKLESK